MRCWLQKFQRADINLEDKEKKGHLSTIEKLTSQTILLNKTHLKVSEKYLRQRMSAFQQYCIISRKLAKKRNSIGPPLMAEQKQDDQLEHTYSSYVKIRDVVQKTCRRRWTIEKSGKRGSGISMRAARHDDDMMMMMIWTQSKSKSSTFWNVFNAISAKLECFISLLNSDL